jgi:hypothetical protein
MARAFGFDFRTGAGVVLFVVALVALVLAYTHQLSESVRSHPEGARLAVREHCRFMVGRQLGEGLGRAEFEERMQACDDFHIREITVRGGLLRPVIVRIALDPQQPLPLGKDVFIFRSDLVGYTVLPGLAGLAAGRWEFNHFNVYSEQMFRSSY